MNGVFFRRRRRSAQKVHLKTIPPPSSESQCAAIEAALSFLPQTSKHWNSCSSSKSLSVRIEGFQPQQRRSHLLDSECVSASFTPTALTVICTVRANCLPCCKQGRLCIQYADGTQIIVAHRKTEMKKESKERDRMKEVTPFRPSHECLLCGFWMQVCVSSPSLCCLCVTQWMRTKHTQTKPGSVRWLNMSMNTVSVWRLWFECMRDVSGRPQKPRRYVVGCKGPFSLIRLIAQVKHLNWICLHISTRRRIHAESKMAQDC